jgi:uncharacterized protein with HEPN domain
LYLLNILESVQKITLYARGAGSAEELYERADQLHFNACLSLLTQIGESAGKISDELKRKENHVEWTRIKSLRNRITHDYTGVDILIVYNIIKDDLPLLLSTITGIIVNYTKSGVFDPKELLLAKSSTYYRHIDFAFLQDLGYGA